MNRKIKSNNYDHMKINTLPCEELEKQNLQQFKSTYQCINQQQKGLKNCTSPTFATQNQNTRTIGGNFTQRNYSAVNTHFISDQMPKKIDVALLEGQNIKLVEKAKNLEQQNKSIKNRLTMYRNQLENNVNKQEKWKNILTKMNFKLEKGQFTHYWQFLEEVHVVKQHLKEKNRLIQELGKDNENKNIKIQQLELIVVNYDNQVKQLNSQVKNCGQCRYIKQQNKKLKQKLDLQIKKNEQLKIQFRKKQQQKAQFEEKYNQLQILKEEESKRRISEVKSNKQFQEQLKNIQFQQGKLNNQINNLQKQRQSLFIDLEKNKQTQRQLQKVINRYQVGQEKIKAQNQQFYKQVSQIKTQYQNKIDRAEKNTKKVNQEKLILQSACLDLRNQLQITIGENKNIQNLNDSLKRQLAEVMESNEKQIIKKDKNTEILSSKIQQIQQLTLQLQQHRFEKNKLVEDLGKIMSQNERLQGQKIELTLQSKVEKQNYQKQLKKMMFKIQDSKNMHDTYNPYNTTNHSNRTNSTIFELQSVYGYKKKKLHDQLKDIVYSMHHFLQEYKKQNYPEMDEDIINCPQKLIQQLQVNLDDIFECYDNLHKKYQSLIIKNNDHFQIEADNEEILFLQKEIKLKQIVISKLTYFVPTQSKETVIQFLWLTQGMAKINCDGHEDLSQYYPKQVKAYESISNRIETESEQWKDHILQLQQNNKLQQFQMDDLRKKIKQIQQKNKKLLIEPQLNRNQVKNKYRII